MELQNPRHERFAVNLSLGMKQGRAYEKAGFAANRGAASHLAKTDHIVERVAELRAERRALEEQFDDSVDYSEDWCCAKLLMLADLAKENGNLKVARDCLSDIRKIKAIGRDQHSASPTAKDHRSNPDALPLPSTINLNVLIDAAQDGAVLPENLRDDDDDKVVRLLSPKRN